ncbi:MAG TPA: cell division protein FtsZ [Bryobacteraceae bacterium]|nr:cell division protein FtsZ [Bryobacteraceae bacterium]
MGLIDSNLDDLKYEMEEERTGARFKVIGIGGGGCNAVSRMVQEGVEGVEFYAMNTDLQALSACNVPNKLQLGTKVTNGLGAGSNPDVGRQAALENTDSIVEILQGADMVFVTAGLGGGTGTGAAPVVASLARELDALVVAVVTKPFTFEGSRRRKAAELGLAQLAATVDSVIAIPNDRLLSLVPRGTSIGESFRVADEVLRQTVQGITDIIITPGLINRDFADIRATMVGMGYAMMGAAIGRGETAAADAAKQAISCPLLEETSIAGARGVLINITASSRLALHDVDAACAIIREATECEDVQLNFGVTINESMADTVKVTVIATGFKGEIASPANRWETPQIRIQAPPEPTPAPAPAPAPIVEPTPAPAPTPFFEPEPILQLEPEAEPEPVQVEDPEPILDMDDLDTPAYLRQGRLLN